MHIRFQLCRDDGAKLVTGTIPVTSQPRGFEWHGAHYDSIIVEGCEILHGFKLELTPVLESIVAEVDPASESLTLAISALEKIAKGRNGGKGLKGYGQLFYQVMAKNQKKIAAEVLKRILA